VDSKIFPGVITRFSVERGGQGDRTGEKGRLWKGRGGDGRGVNEGETAGKRRGGEWEGREVG
jgi:hypothetical protein